MDPDTSDIPGLDDAGHRQLAARLFNSTWDLIDSHERTEDQDIEMFLRAATSRWHWQQVGGDEQIAIGDWQVAHVAALLGLGECSVLFARRSLQVAQKLGWDGWRLASAHEGMARACSAVGDHHGHREHVAAAEAALADEDDDESRQLIVDQLASIPDPL